MNYPSTQFQNLYDTMNNEELADQRNSITRQFGRLCHYIQSIGIAKDSIGLAIVPLYRSLNSPLYIKISKELDCVTLKTLEVALNSAVARIRDQADALTSSGSLLNVGAEREITMLLLSELLASFPNEPSFQRLSALIEQAPHRRTSELVHDQSSR
jgi:hypothetical protein